MWGCNDLLRACLQTAWRGWLRCRPSTSMSPSPLTSLDCRAKMVSHSALLYTRSFEQMLKDQVQVGQALYEDQTSDPDPLPEFWFLSSVQAVATTPNLRAFKASIRAAVSRDSPPPPHPPPDPGPPFLPPAPSLCLFVSRMPGTSCITAALSTHKVQAACMWPTTSPPLGGGGVCGVGGGGGGRSGDMLGLEVNPSLDYIRS